MGRERSYYGEKPCVFDRHTFQVFLVVAVFRACVFFARQTWFRLRARTDKYTCDGRDQLGGVASITSKLDI